MDLDHGLDDDGLWYRNQAFWRDAKGQPVTLATWPGQSIQRYSFLVRHAGEVHLRVIDDRLIIWNESGAADPNPMPRVRLFCRSRRRAT